MGLDILAFSKCKKLDVVYDADGEPIDSGSHEPMSHGSFTRIYVNPDFPGRADEFEDKGCYAYEQSDGFCAGSYFGYNHWREKLAELAGYQLESSQEYGRERASHCAACWRGEGGPFSELINFSDCEGAIGAAASKKLAADFAEFQTKADTHPDEHFRKKYGEWRAVFELAADDGCVCFH